MTDRKSAMLSHDCCNEVKFSRQSIGHVMRRTNVEMSTFVHLKQKSMGSTVRN